MSLIGRADCFTFGRTLRCSGFGCSIYCIIPFCLGTAAPQCSATVASRLSDLNLSSNWHTLSLRWQKMQKCLEIAQMFRNCSVGVWSVGQCNKIYSQIIHVGSLCSSCLAQLFCLHWATGVLRVRNICLSDSRRAEAPGWFNLWEEVLPRTVSQTRKMNLDKLTIPFWDISF